MIDTQNQQPVRVQTDMITGPHIVVTEPQLTEVSQLLKANNIPHKIDEWVVRFDDDPEVGIVHLDRQVDLTQVQVILDSAP